jgi:SAM-dependent methyltransferase
MRVDVFELQRFYGSRLGESARRLTANRIAALWPNLDGLDVLGLGYAPPLLEPFRERARRVVASMPQAQGAERWPACAPCSTVLADDARLPFCDAVFDRVLIVHALEEADDPRALLREVWRVMAPEGRLLVIAANRAGLWARGEGTPFGYGRPYSRSQLSQLLSSAMFEPTASTVALHTLPLNVSAALVLADGLERAGELLRSPFGGLVMMEAVKRLYAKTAKEGRQILLANAPVRVQRRQRGAGRTHL